MPFGISEYGIAEFGDDGETFNLPITSKAKIVYNKNLDRYKTGFDILYNQFAYKKDIIYRRYVFGENNLSGDKDYAFYNDYDLTAEIQLKGETRDVGIAGYSISLFGFIFLPAIIQYDRYGNELPTFRPQIKDEFYFDGRWYVIQNIQPPQFALHTLGMECMFRLISEEINPR